MVAAVRRSLEIRHTAVVLFINKGCQSDFKYQPKGLLVRSDNKLIF